MTHAFWCPTIALLSTTGAVSHQGWLLSARSKGVKSLNAYAANRDMFVGYIMPAKLARAIEGKGEAEMELERHFDIVESEPRRWDFSDLRALFLNCTLKRSPELSHTEGLVRISRAIMEKNGVSVEELRPID